jgi:hypothetical protein
MLLRKLKLATWLVAPVALGLGAFLMSVPGASAAGADVYGVGGGSISLEGRVKIIKFAFSGHTGPSGGFGRVRVSYEDPLDPLDVHVDVDCVKVVPFLIGAGGWMGGAVTKVTGQPNGSPIAPGDQFLLGFNDFGEPSDPIPDEMNFVRGAPQFCKFLEPSPHTRSRRGTSSSRPTEPSLRANVGGAGRGGTTVSVQSPWKRAGMRRYADGPVNTKDLLDSRSVVYSSFT